MKIRKPQFIGVCLLLIINAGLTQNVTDISRLYENGLPLISTFLPENYQAHGQNWGIIQDRDGLLYFANTDGLILQFDGVTWRNIPVSNGSIVRSLAIDTAGTIYAGAQNEFGYLAADSTGTLQYISLLSALDSSNRDFGNVWQIHATPGGVYFSTRKYLFRLETKGEIRVWKAPTSFQSAFYLPEYGIFIHQTGNGLMALKDDSLQLLPGGDSFSGDRVYAVLPGPNEQLLIGSRNSGLSLLKQGRVMQGPEKINAWLTENQIYHGLRLREGGYAFATIRGGMLVLDQNLNTAVVISKDAGIPDNNVWFVLQDRDGALWMATNRGIVQVQYPSPLTVFDPRTGLEGNVQDIVRHHGIIYAATGLGLYRKNYSGPLEEAYGFDPVPDLKSQCWALLSLTDRLLVSCNLGVYQLDDRGISRITEKSAWKMIRSAPDPNRIFLGLDDGVASLYKYGVDWRDEGRLPGISAEARTIAEDKAGDLWIGTVYEGIYRIRFGAPGIKTFTVDHFDTANGLPAVNYNLVFPGIDQLLFGTSNGIYLYEETSAVFSPLDLISRDSRQASYTMLSVARNGDIWFNRNERPALIRSDTLHYRKFMGVPKSSLYTFYPETDGTLWMGGTGGILRYYPSVAGDEALEFRTVIRRIAINSDSTIFGGANMKSFRMPDITYAQHDLRFEYAALSFTDPGHNEYQYLLEGFDRSWSRWTSETRKDYTHIPEGRYTFRVRSRNVFGIPGQEASTSFRILAPWFRSGWAYLIYIVMIGLLTYASVKTIVSRAKQRAIAERMKVIAIEKAAEEKLRSRVAADFHDELGNRITRISLFGEILMNDLKTKNEQTRNYLTRIIENADNLYNETRDFIWQLDPKKDTLYDLVVRLKNFADELYAGTDIAFQVSGFNRNLGKIRLTMDSRQHILRIFKEALHNALKYAGCQNITFIVELDNKAARLRLHDDGIGFDTGKHRNQGNGLVNMAERAKALNGDLLIESKPGKGTCVQLTIKLPEQAVV